MDLTLGVDGQVILPPDAGAVGRGDPVGDGLDVEPQFPPLAEQTPVEGVDPGPVFFPVRNDSDCHTGSTVPPRQFM